MTHKEATRIVLEITRRLCRRQRVVLRCHDGSEVSVECCHIHWPHWEGDDFGVGFYYTDWEACREGKVKYGAFGQTGPHAGSWVWTAAVAQRFTRREASRIEGIWTNDAPGQ